MVEIMNDRIRKISMKYFSLFPFSVFCILFSIIFMFTPVFSQDITQKVDGFTLEGFNDVGDRTWEVKGTTADIFGDTIKILNVDANAFGEQEVNLKAKRGLIDKKSGNVQLNEDVVVTTQDGSRLETDSLNWEKQSNIISTLDSAQIFVKNIEANGIGLKAYPQLKMAQLDHDVTVKVQAESRDGGKDQEIIITCDGPMELDQQNNMATLRGNVLVVRGDQTLRADMIEIYFDPETNKIVTIVCTDNVIVQRGDNISYSDKAIYSAADQKVIFVGRPKLIMSSQKDEKSFF